MCVSPYIVKTENGVVPVPCGRCFECLQQWSKDWRFRLKYEQNDSMCSLYCTLTYDSEHISIGWNEEAKEYQSYIVKSDLQKFFKRVRKNCPAFKFRYFAIGEYGEVYNRCHFHVIFFCKTFPFRSKNMFYLFVKRNWSNGFIYLKWTENRHINYVSTYFNKVDKSPHLVEPCKFMSKSIGLSFLTPLRISYFFRSFKSSFPNPFGKGWLKLPRYYRKKLDEMTSSVVPDNYGYRWSDIVSMYSREYKGIEKHFDNFCKNYDTYLADYIKNCLHSNRVDGSYCSPCLDDVNPAKVFYKVFYFSIPEIQNARLNDMRSLNDVMVHHKYTRLKCNDYG